MIEMFSNWIYSVLIWLYGFIPNLGLVIIVFTLIFRLLLLALTWKSTKQTKSMQAMSVELKKLQKIYKDDPQTLQLKTIELNKKYNINPLLGCLPQLLQIFVLIFLYRALYTFIQQPVINGVAINTHFLIWDLGQKDSYFILPILAGITQLAVSQLMSPATQTRDIIPNDSSKPEIQAENKKEEDIAGMAAGMQSQMMFLMPIMTTVISLGLPAGLVLYWVIGNIFTFFQTGLINGWSGLAFWKNFKSYQKKQAQKLITLAQAEQKKSSQSINNFTQALQKSSSTSRKNKKSRHPGVKSKNPPQKINKKSKK